jgi:dihydroorotase
VLWEALLDGRMGITDHAPYLEKQQPYLKAPSGAISATCSAAMFEAHHQGKISVEKL